jgi:hypothetical protein
MDGGRYNDEPALTSHVDAGANLGGRVCHLAIWCGEEDVPAISAGVGLHGVGNISGQF